MTAANLALTRLADARPAARVRVAAIAAGDALALADVGVRVGVRLTIERHLPLGGPVIVSLGSTRIAIARVVAVRIGAETVPEPDATQPEDPGA